MCPAYTDSAYTEAMRQSVLSTSEVGIATDGAVRAILQGLDEYKFVTMTYSQYGLVNEGRYHALATGKRSGVA